MSVTVAREELLQFVERIERVFSEIDDLNLDKREIYGEAEGAGIDKTALSKVVGIRRSRAKNAEKFDERDATVQLYLDLLDGHMETVPSHARIRAREIDRLTKGREELFKRLDAERAEDRSVGRPKSVYFIHSRDTGMVKIGVSHDVQGRLATLQTASPAPLRLLLSFPGDHQREAELHETFSGCRIHGEWFSTEDGAIMDFIAGFVPVQAPPAPVLVRTINEIPPPDATPAGAVVAEPSGVTAERERPIDTGGESRERQRTGTAREAPGPAKPEAPPMEDARKGPSGTAATIEEDIPDFLRRGHPENKWAVDPDHAVPSHIREAGART